MGSWTTPAELRDQLLRLWDRARILSARFEDQPLFPLRLRLKRPTQRELLERYDEARGWIRALEAGEARSGAGYRLEWEEIQHRQLGANRVPSIAVLDSEEDALSLIGKTAEGRRFTRICEETLARFPMLSTWLRDSPLVALAHHHEWAAILETLEWFRAHPSSDRYLRQVDVQGVHTKFIEARRGLLTELLDQILPESAVNRSATGTFGFEARYGLRVRPTLVRMRVLDPKLAVGGLLDVTAPLEQLAALPLRFSHVFVTENDVNALAFPELEDSVILFGGGYALERLASLSWLASAPVYYWGDLDTHGFAMLDRLRGVLPTVRSFLMDRETLLAHRALWTEEPEGKRHLASLNRLTPPECALYDDLRGDRLGERIRLEQERIGFGSIERAISAVRSEGREVPQPD